MTTPNKTLPRFELREPAFRRLEPIIARAAMKSGTLTLNPKTDLLEYGVSMNPHSFALRFRDAILGMKRYGYKSTLIPSNFDLSKLKVKEDVNGLRVHIENTNPKSIALTGGTKIPFDDTEALNNVIKMKRQEPPNPEYYGVEFLIEYNTTKQRDKILELAGALAEDRPGEKGGGVVSIV